MPLQCQNCHRIVSTVKEMDGCRGCSMPPPPPTRERYDMDAADDVMGMHALVAFQEGLLTERIPPFTRLDYRLFAQQGLPDPKVTPPHIPTRSVDIIDDEPAFV